MLLLYVDSSKYSVVTNDSVVRQKKNGPMHHRQDSSSRNSLLVSLWCSAMHVIDLLEAKAGLFRGPSR